MDRMIDMRRRRSQAQEAPSRPRPVMNVTPLVDVVLGTKTSVAAEREQAGYYDEIRKVAKELGYVAAVAVGNCCLSAVLFRPRHGQQIKLPLVGEFSSRIAAACVSLGGGCGCCYASVYGISNSTAGQKEQLSRAVRVTLEEMWALGRGSCLI